MSKFKKKKTGALPPISTASLPDIVFMLLFFFMVVTVLRESNLLVMQRLPKGDFETGVVGLTHDQVGFDPICLGGIKKKASS